MHDLDDDDREPYPPPWHAGPPPRRTPGPVIETYADTGALEHTCPHCHAAAGEFCRHDPAHGGTQRKAPCPKRILAATADTRDRRCDETLTPNQPRHPNPENAPTAATASGTRQ